VVGLDMNLPDNAVRLWIRGARRRMVALRVRHPIVVGPHQRTSTPRPCEAMARAPGPPGCAKTADIGTHNEQWPVCMRVSKAVIDCRVVRVPPRGISVDMHAYSA
jgi:hypothetical protein